MGPVMGPEVDGYEEEDEYYDGAVPAYSTASDAASGFSFGKVELVMDRCVCVF